MKMQRKSIAWVITVLAALCIAPSLSLAQTPPPDAGSSDLAPFLGRWVGVHEECSSGSSCETRNAEMVISVKDGKPSIYTRLSPADAGFQRYSKSSKGPVERTLPGVIVKQDGGVGLSFTMKSGTKVILRLQEGGKLIGSGSGGRFRVSYRLQKAGS